MYPSKFLAGTWAVVNAYLMVPMQNLLGYTENYSKISRSL